MRVVEVEKDERLYRAEYSLDENVVTVYGERGQESTQLGGMSEYAVARMILNNLIRNGKIDPVGT